MSLGNTEAVSTAKPNREIEGLLQQAREINNRLAATNSRFGHVRDRILGPVPSEVSSDPDNAPTNNEMQEFRDVLDVTARELSVLEDLANAFEGL